jgi:hypothetical protein
VQGTPVVLIGYSWVLTRYSRGTRMGRSRRAEYGCGAAQPGHAAVAWHDWVPHRAPRYYSGTHAVRRPSQVGAGRWGVGASQALCCSAQHHFRAVHGGPSRRGAHFGALGSLTVRYLRGLDGCSLRPPHPAEYRVQSRALVGAPGAMWLLFGPSIVLTPCGLALVQRRHPRRPTPGTPTRRRARRPPSGRPTRRRYRRRFPAVRAACTRCR